MRLSSALAPVFLLAATSSHATDNVILVTLDGVRIQELFGGMDPSLVDRPEDSGIYDPEVTRSRYWRDCFGRSQRGARGSSEVNTSSGSESVTMMSSKRIRSPFAPTRSVARRIPPKRCQLVHR